MSALSERLATLPPNHRAALEWFDAHRGMDIPKPQPVNGVHVFNPQTGIQKPAGWVHAVSVRQTLTSAYDDHAPVIAPDGSWTYRYYQERTDPDQAARIATNRALLANRDDDVPVAVMIQIKPKPGVRYRIWGLAKVAGFSDGYFYLQGYNDLGDLASPDFPYPIASPQLAAVAESTAPLSLEDARRKIDAQIVARQGGAAFRNAALKRFNGCCAISGWGVPQVLEAAHIVPYLGVQTNTLDNALLLRADLHTLFDRELLRIDPETLKIELAAEIANGPYAGFAGQEVHLPDDVTRNTFRDRLRERAELLRPKTP